MDRLDAIKIFVRVVESGSFSAVARELGVGQPAVSKQVASLEAHLGAQLLMRTSQSQPDRSRPRRDQWDDGRSAGTLGRIQVLRCRARIWQVRD